MVYIIPSVFIPINFATQFAAGRAWSYKINSKMVKANNEVQEQILDNVITNVSEKLQTLNKREKDISFLFENKFSSLINLRINSQI